MKKVSIAGIIIGVITVIVSIIMESKSASSISIIGGADGPTSIFLAGKVSVGCVAGILIFGVICIILGVVLLIKSKHNKRKEM